MADLFGKAFYRENGEQPRSLWIAAIERLNDQQIIRGLNNLAEDNLQFPANLSMFLAACKREALDAGPRRLGVEYKVLSHDEASENAEKAWKAMEELVGYPLTRTKETGPRR